jgi:sodium/potassium/calcium exchanger 6
LVGLIVVGVSFLVAVLIALTSHAEYPPAYYGGFSFVGFLISIVWIYIITSEIVNVLEAASIIVQLSRALVGLLILAFGNSVCDLVANFFVARNGKAIMGFSACYGSPLLNMLIGISLGFLIAISKHHGTYTVKMTPQLGVAAGFLISELILAIIVIVARRWIASRLLGVTLPTVYAIFVVVLLCVEFTS